VKCGDLGHKTVTGQPCQQNIPHGAKGCLWHTRTPEERTKLARFAGITSQKHRLIPETYKANLPPFDTRENVIKFAEQVACAVLTSSVDAKRVDVALRAASVALSGFQAITQEKLNEALLKLEGGGAALILLERLKVAVAEGKHRPLPGARTLTIPPGDGEGALEG
jgi:hypothetical protein